MSRNEDLAAYYSALAKSYAELERLAIEARRLGVSAPVFGEIGSAPSTRPRPRTARKAKAGRRAARSKPKSISAAPTLFGENGGAKRRVAVSDLSRPELCFAILRRAGKPLQSNEIADEASKLGSDWSHVSGGKSNAVHGAMWREKQKGRVNKTASGWVLKDHEIGAILSADGKWAEMPDHAGSAKRRLASERRDFLVRQFRSGNNNPQGLLDAMRRTEDYRSINRSQLRDDLDTLIADGKIEKAGYGEYRVISN